MSSYCLKYGENTKNIILQISKAINGGIIILSKCVVSGDRKSKFIKKQKADRLSNNLVIKKLLSATPLSKIPVFIDIIK